MTINTLTKKQQKQQKKIDAFSELLEDLASSTDKKKMLWKEIYENALFDRWRFHNGIAAKRREKMLFSVVIIGGGSAGI